MVSIPSYILRFFLFDMLIVVYILEMRSSWYTASRIGSKTWALKIKDTSVMILIPISKRLAIRTIPFNFGFYLVIGSTNRVCPSLIIMFWANYLLIELSWHIRKVFSLSKKQFIIFEKKCNVVFNVHQEMGVIPLYR